MKIAANGISFNYWLEGPANAPVVMLSSSLATNLSMWDPQVPTFTSRYRVLRYDMRGHGETDAPEGAYTLHLLADDVRALLRALGIARTHFVGLSIGGMIGQTLGLESPQILQSLVVCDTTSRMPPESRGMWEERIQVARTQGMEPHVETTINRWFTDPFRKAHPEAVDPIRAMIRQTKPTGYIGCCHAIMSLNFTDRLHEIAVPTLVVVGEDDPSAPVAAARTIHERIKGSELAILKSASHISNVEQPDAFNRSVLSFLANH